MNCAKCNAPKEENTLKCSSCGETIQPANAGVQGPTRESGLAIASMVCSIVGLMVCFFIGQIVGIVLGYRARREIKASGGSLRGENFATAGIIIGWVGIAIDILIVAFWGLFMRSFFSEIFSEMACF